jgi:c(7)-type cytochrome triheme protein
MLEEPNRQISTAQRPSAQTALRWRRLLVLLIVGLGFPVAHVYNTRAVAFTADQPNSLSGSGLGDPTEQEPNRDFSKFTHSNETHAALPCLACHRRDNDSPRSTLPGHMPCAGCHTQRFNDSGSPICTICHTDVQAGKVKSFPGLRSFGVKFDHSQHITGAARTKAGCATCHTPIRGGVALSIPAGAGAHATCYQCHTSRAQGPSGRDISSCSTCHSPGRLIRAPESARAYLVSFSHASHVRGQGLSCSACHNISPGMQNVKQVTSPMPLMHHASARAQSCMSCHDNKRAFGIENFADCKRCHQGQHFYF